MSPTELQLTAGLVVGANRERVSSISSRFYSGNEPAMVTLHRLGSDVRIFLTTHEARRLAHALAEAADYAESRP